MTNEPHDARDAHDGSESPEAVPAPGSHPAMDPDMNPEMDPQMDEAARLTAYALGELEGEERAALERRIDGDDEALATVDSIRRTAALLEHELRAEAASGLTDAQRRQIAEGPDGAPAAGPGAEGTGDGEAPAPAPLNRPWIFNARLLWIGSGLAAAACLMIAFGSELFLSPDRFSADAPTPSAQQRRAAVDQLADRDGASGGADAADEELMRLAQATEAMSKAPRPAPGPGTGLEQDGRAAGEEAAVVGSVVVEDAAEGGPPRGRRPPVGRPRRPSGPGGGGMGAGGGGMGAGGSPPPDDSARGRRAESESRRAPARAESAPPPPPADPAPAASSAAPAEQPEPESLARALNDVEVDANLDGKFHESDAVVVTRALMEATGRTVEESLKGEDLERVAVMIETYRAARLEGDSETTRRLQVQLEDAAREIGRRQRELRDRFARVPGSEEYEPVTDNPFVPCAAEPRSTFSIDVDTASYGTTRRFLGEGRLPPPGAVRIEELINYFTYDYAPPAGPEPFSVTVDVAEAPWRPAHRLVRVGLKGREIDVDMRPATNLVFLIDVSGSMKPGNKLPLVKQSLRLLLDRLLPDDRVSIVTYASGSDVVLPSTYCFEREAIRGAIDSLHASGSTNGAAGIQAAYDIASSHFIEGGVNRVMLATDGDFNVGPSDTPELVSLIEDRRRSGVFLSILGFGTGNFKDARLEAISNSGNGQFAYIDGLDEARKVLVDQLAGTLVTIAKDVKIQVEFHPDHVGAWRLLGYENRRLATADFNDDRKDAGEIGAGHTVTALYEIVPPGAEENLARLPDVDELEFQKPQILESDAMMVVKLRYKEPDGEESKLLRVPVTDGGATLGEAPGDFRFAAAVAAYGMILRGSPYRGDATLDMVEDLARSGLETTLTADEAAKLADDFVVHAGAGRVELARANLDALLAAPLSDPELARVVEGEGERAIRFKAGAVRARQNEVLSDLVEPLETLEARVALGREALRSRPVRQVLLEAGYRSAFVEMVEKTKAIKAGN